MERLRARAEGVPVRQPEDAQLHSQARPELYSDGDVDVAGRRATQRSVRKLDRTKCKWRPDNRGAIFLFRDLLVIQRYAE